MISEYGKGKHKITVDHTNQVVDAVIPDMQAEQGTDNSAERSADNPAFTGESGT